MSEAREGELLPREADAAIERELDRARPLAPAPASKVVVLRGPAALAATAVAIPLMMFAGAFGLIVLVIIVLLFGVLRSWQRATPRKT